MRGRVQRSCLAGQPRSKPPRSPRSGVPLSSSDVVVVLVAQCDKDVAPVGTRESREAVGQSTDLTHVVGIGDLSPP